MWVWALVAAALLAVWRRAWPPIPAALLGFCWASLHAGWVLDRQLPPALEGQDVVVEGRVASLPTRSESNLRFNFAIAQMHHGAREYPAPGRARLSFYGAEPDITPRVGEVWRLRVRLKQPHGFRNAGGFDYERWLFQQRIRATGYVRSWDGNVRLKSPLWWHAVDRFRAAFAEKVAAILPTDPNGAIIIALATGDRSRMTAGQWDVMLATGTNHLVAISGLHVGLVAGLVFFLVQRLWPWCRVTLRWCAAPVAAATAAILAAGGYAALAGFSLPTQRALIMLGVVLGAIGLRRRVAPSVVLATSLLCVLVLDPLAVLSASFWLSFLAVAAIVASVSGRHTAVKARWRSWGRLQWALALALLPIVVLLFGRASVIAPLANFIAVPVIGMLIVPVVLAAVAAYAVAWQGAAAAGLQAAAWLLGKIWVLLETLAAWDHAVWWQHEPAAWTLVAAAVGAGLFLAPRGLPGRWLASLWFLPLCLVPAPRPAAQEFWLTVLDVGQGTAAVVQTRNHVLLYDTGARFSPTFDAGQAVVVPFLRSGGVKRIDRLVLSHSDTDHMGGADAVRRAFAFGAIDAGEPDEIEGARGCAELPPWQWDGIEFRYFDPGPAYRQGNDASCVLSVRGPGGHVLLPGDIEAAAEHALIRRYASALPADLLVVPHHGSKTSSTPSFLNAVNPQFAVFTAGYRNRYRHPHPDVIQRYRTRGANLFATARDGAIQVRLQRAGISVTTYRAKHRRYWSSH